MAGRIHSEERVRRLFGDCTWPELNIALRHLNTLVLERAEDHARTAREQKEYDRRAEEEIRLGRLLAS